jgi:hypothetical protein
LSTRPAALSPAALAIAPDLHLSRPAFCPHPSCLAVPAPGLVGLHGDGLSRRFVAYPVDDDATEFVDVEVCSRRYWCPACRHGCLVDHPGILPRLRASAAAVAAAVHAAAPPPVGEGLRPVEIRERITGNTDPVPASERARAGEPRWFALRRWVARLEWWWPSLVLIGRTLGARAGAFVAALAPGAAVGEVVAAAVRRLGRGGAAM